MVFDEGFPCLHGIQRLRQVKGCEFGVSRALADFGFRCWCMTGRPRCGQDEGCDSKYRPTYLFVEGGRYPWPRAWMAVHGRLNLFNRLEAIFGILFEATENDFLDVIGDGSIDLSGTRGRLLNLVQSDGDRGITSE